MASPRIPARQTSCQISFIKLPHLHREIDLPLENLRIPREGPLPVIFVRVRRNPLTNKHPFHWLFTVISPSFLFF